MNTTNTDVKVSVIIDKEHYDELERRANRTGEDVRKDATTLLVGLVEHLRRMKNPMDPSALADFISLRSDLYIKELK